MKTYNYANEGLRDLKLTNFLAGFILALGALFVALEFSHREVRVIEGDIIYDYKVEDDLIPLTFHQEVMSAPPAAAPTVMEYINEVMDDVVLQEDEVFTFNDALADKPGKGSDGIGVDTDGRIGTVVGPVAPLIDDIVIFPDTPAEFPGDLNDWLSKNLKYPAICQEQGVQGRVVVTFVVNKDGSIESDSIRIRRSPNSYFSAEAERIVRMMPKWTPALKDNKYVPSYFTLPILFRLQ